uniref:Putative potassium channel subunit n2P24 n=1 Tax=Caenorhabditis elegans TaxID=6239 RepID=G5ECU9_CAEEL|nr:putative potassium channel subunit n2P24 [Caenorhabditis elegans]
MNGTTKKDDKIVAGRSKSADSKWKDRMNRGLGNMSKSLPSFNKNAANAKSDKTSDTKVVIEDESKKKKKKKKKDKNLDVEELPQQEDPEVLAAKEKEKKAKVMIASRDARNKTMWRHIAWLVVLFSFSLFGGVIFSAIEGGYETTQLIKKFEHEKDVYERRKIYQEQLFQRLREIEHDNTNPRGRNSSREHFKLEQSRHALEWYEQKMGVTIEEPQMRETKWNLWGGVYYSASLYTTIGYGNFHPLTKSGRIISMMYACIGIPLVFTILLDWGFLYFTWIEYGWNRFNENFCQKSLQRDMQRRIRRERIRRVGSELSLSSTAPLLHRTTTQLSNPVQHIESNHPLSPLDVDVPMGEQVQTVPIKSAAIFFFLWIMISAFIVRLWEYEWTYFTAFYFFFTSLTTIGLGDVVTKTPNFIIFNLAMTLIGLSVVGLCAAIVQAKVKLVFDRMLRSIDAQYRIRQVDPHVATMSIVEDEEEGVKRLIQSQSLEDRIIFLFVDEHKKSMLKERITQTYPSKADKYVQTGQRVYDQRQGSDEDLSDEDEEDVEYDELGNKIIPPPIRRYIYTVFD